MFTVVRLGVWVDKRNCRSSSINSKTNACITIVFKNKSSSSINNNISNTHELSTVQMYWMFYARMVGMTRCHKKVGDRLWISMMMIMMSGSCLFIPAPPTSPVYCSHSCLTYTFRFVTHLRLNQCGVAISLVLYFYPVSAIFSSSFAVCLRDFVYGISFLCALGIDWWQWNVPRDLCCTRFGVAL